MKNINIFKLGVQNLFSGKMYLHILFIKILLMRKLYTSTRYHLKVIAGGIKIISSNYR